MFLNVFLPFIIVIIIIIYLVYSFLVLMFLFWHVQSSYFLSLMFFFVSRSCFTVRILSRIKDIIKHEYNNAKKPKQKIVCERQVTLLQVIPTMTFQNSRNCFGPGPESEMVIPCQCEGRKATRLIKNVHSQRSEDRRVLVQLGSFRLVASLCFWKYTFHMIYFYHIYKL